MGFGATSRRSAAGTWMDLSFTGGSQQSYGVWSSAPNDVWITSGDGVGGRVSHYDGGLWADLPGATPFVYGIWGFSPNEVYLGGEGHVWTSRGLGPLTSVLNLAPDLAPVRGLWGSPTWPLTGVTQGGRIVSRSLPDAGWTSQAIPNGSLSAIHGAALPDGGADVWTVGRTGALFHLEGTTWRFVDAGQGPIELHAVFTEGDRVWVTGQDGTVLLGAQNGWERVVTPAGGNIRGVWAQADGGGVWFVGDFGQIVSKIPGR